MKSLSAKGAARTLAMLSIAGCVLSLEVYATAVFGALHGAAPFGLSLRDILRIQNGLFYGCIVLLIPVILAWGSLVSRSNLLDQRVPKLISLRKEIRGLAAPAPKWIRTSSSLLFVYAAVEYANFVVKAYPDARASAWSNLFVLGPFTAALYSIAAMFLMAYVRADDFRQARRAVPQAR